MTPLEQFCTASNLLKREFPLRPFHARSRQRRAGHGQAGGGDQAHPEGTAFPHRPRSDHGAHDGAAPAGHLLEPGKR